jgi:glycosyltransferase involved in cell wall biosynthesis
MPRLLYLSPYFPPQTKVGALRPLKFVRHLGRHGWSVHVLADLRGGDDVEADLLGDLPGDVDVTWGWTPSAGRNRRRVDPNTPRRAPPPISTAPATRPRATGPRLGHLLPRIPWSPEYVPLGEHSIEIPWALHAASRLLRRERFDAILVNADPYAAMIVGDRLGRRFGLPVVHDLRDPWSVCDLRRPERPALQRAIVDHLERGVVERAARVVLNSDATLAAYRAHYADVDPDRFACIRNHSDPQLIAHEGRALPDGPFAVLFLGSLRRHLHGDPLFEAFRRLHDRGLGADQARLVITARLSPEAREVVDRLDLHDAIVEFGRVPYRQIAPVMASADLLVALNNASTMRLPAKLYDYAMSARPLLVLADPGHAELRGLAARLPGATFVDMGDPDAIADAIVAELAQGRRRQVARADTGLDSATATARLAEILDAAIARR